MNSINIKFVKGKKAILETGPLRLEVFEQEQGFVDEFDEFDEASIHVIIKHDDQVIASGRMYEEHPGIYHLGRIVVKKEYRASGYGRVVVSQLVEHAKTLNAKQCVLSSQTHACRFYELCGFVKDGPVIYEQNQPHQMMIYNI
ncbi:MAG: GNAT family N-acetyltransferase [Erysipelothrix sp.]|jgi:predicted GNAT family N-acyltransferase|nr:GNAT family N-acetyltransferase [Erysipelothrix sp.]